VDDYDARDQLFQFQEGHYVPGFNVLGGTTIRNHLHFDRALLHHREWPRGQPNASTVGFPADHFTADAVTEEDDAVSRRGAL